MGLNSYKRNSIGRRVIAFCALFAFLLNSIVFPIRNVFAQENFQLPAPGVMVGLSPDFMPPVLRGIKIYPNNPFRFDFILDKGNSDDSDSRLKEEAVRLIKYFLASLTVPEKDLWVNLSPYEKDRIIPDEFGLTEMGRDLLAEDYMLKQITASIIYPEGEIGEKFWKKVYDKAYERYGTTDIPIDTFNKVWIVPEKAVVYENAQAGTAYVKESRLKVMLESDYLAREKNASVTRSSNNETQELAKTVVKEIVIPELEREVNEGKNFSKVRQVYQSIILAAWYKKKIKQSLLDKVYVDQKKVAGVNVDNPEISKEIWEQYVQAFKKGAYDYIKEEYDPTTQEVIPRKYFSGGAEFTDFAMQAALQVEAVDNASVADALVHQSPSRLITVASVVSPLGVPVASLPLSGASNLNRPSSVLSHIQSKSRMDRILRILAQSEGDSLGAYSNSTQIVEKLIDRLKERGLIREDIDEEGNVVIEIEPVAGDRLYQAFDKWVFNPVNGPGVKAINFQSDEDGEYKGQWVILGLASELGNPVVLKHEKKEAKLRRDNPNKSWVWAHNEAVRETGEGELIDENIDLKDNGNGSDIGTGLFDWLKKSSDKVLTDKSIEELKSQGARLIDTDMTLDYGGLKKWNLDRIFIDLVQNHKPADAKGRRLYVRINLKDGRTLDVADPNLVSISHDSVANIEIGDDGVGYDYDHLKYFLTTKGSQEQGGKFGEGLKIATAAALSAGMTLEFRSRSWIGKPLLQEKVLNEGHPNEIKTKNVVLAVRDNGGIKGSRTVIYEPSASFLEVVKRGTDLVLDLRKGYQAAARLDGVGEIVGESVGEKSVVYVKRNKILAMPDRQETYYPALFDYNFFEDEALNRDRDTLPNSVISKTVFGILLKVATPQMINKMIRAVILPDMKDSYQIGRFYENQSWLDDDLIKGMSQGDKDRWKNVFYEIFGAGAVIGSMESGQPDETSKKAMEKGLRVVFLNNGNIKKILLMSGVGGTRSLYFQKEMQMDTAVSLDYRQAAWSFDRILLDGVQNHLKTDSGATEIHAEFQVKGEGAWRDISEVDGYTNEQISSIRLRDDGHGYDYHLLGILHSTKTATAQTAGGWGEGLKMLSAAVLREGMGMRLKSREWEAEAGTTNQYYTDANEKSVKVETLVYKMKLFHEREKGSATIFYNLKPELIDLFRSLKKKVLSLDPKYNPVSKTSDGEIVSLDSKTLFVQGLEFSDILHGNHGALMAYNFIGIQDIVTSPDRNVLHPGKVHEAIGNILASTFSIDALQRVLAAAIDDSRSRHPEFQNYLKKSGVTNMDTWKSAWRKLVIERGWNPDRLVLGTRRTLFDPDAQILLRNMGYQVVFIEDHFVELIHSFGVPLDTDLLQEQFEYTDKLSGDEQQVLSFRTTADDLLIRILRSQDTSININEDERRKHEEWASRLEQSPREIEIFSSVKSKVTGVEISGWLGYFNKTTEKIGVARSRLSSKWQFAETYIHETLHWLSGENDDTRAFETAIFSVLTKSVFELDKAGNDHAMISAPGGIDFNYEKMDLQIQNSGEGINFNIDPSMIRQMQNATGLMPIVIDIQPTISLPQFLGLNDNNTAERLSMR